MCSKWNDGNVSILKVFNWAYFVWKITTQRQRSQFIYFGKHLLFNKGYENDERQTTKQGACSMLLLGRIVTIARAWWLITVFSIYRPLFIIVHVTWFKCRVWQPLNQTKPHLHSLTTVARSTVIKSIHLSVRIVLTMYICYVLYWSSQPKISLETNNKYDVKLN